MGMHEHLRCVVQGYNLGKNSTRLRGLYIVAQNVYWTQITLVQDQNQMREKLVSPDTAIIV